MKIRFLALNNTFSHTQIGGTDSYMRRLSFALIRKEFEVEWVFYGVAQSSSCKLNGLKISYFEKFSEALDHCRGAETSVLISCYLKPWDRLKLVKLKLCPQVKLYFLAFFYPDTTFKKLLRYFETLIIGFSAVFCVSQRLVKFYKKIGCRSVYLPPIIPDEYFSTGYEKLKRTKTNIPGKVKALFLGRLDPRKGISEVISLLKLPKLSSKVKWTISGILIEEDLGNLDAQKELEANKQIVFHKEERSDYSDGVEKRVISFLADAEYFLQPYKSLSSTVDLPLLLLEAQAAGCIVLTTLPETLEDYMYGSSQAIAGDFKKSCSYILLSSQKKWMSTWQDKKDLDLMRTLYSQDAVLVQFDKVVHG